MARRVRSKEATEAEAVEAAYLAFRERQLGRLCTGSTRESPRFVRDWPVAAQARFVESALRSRALWAGKDDWVHRWLESRRHD